MIRRSVIVIVLFLLCGCGGGGSSTPSVTPTPTPSSQTPRTGIIIPMYMYPNADWDHVVLQKQAHPRVPVLLIANPASGPGTAADPQYQSAVQKAAASGIVIAGYVATGYGARASSDVEADIDHYVQWYHVNGIFLDEMAPDHTPYYQTLTAYAHARTLQPVVVNPGIWVADGAGADIVVAYESPGYPGASLLNSLAPPAARWSYIAGNVPFDKSQIISTLPYVGYLYATDGTEPQCYCALPSYFDALMSLLDQ